MAVLKRRRDRGASLVEFALILPVFAMLLFGMITAGLALNEKQQMTHATREGARYAAAIAPDQEFDNGQSWAVNVRELIVERSVDVLEAADICVSLVQGSPGTVIDFDIDDDGTSDSAQFSTNGTAPCITSQTYPTSTDDDGLRVQVSTSKPATIDLVLFGSYDVTMDVEATARSESEL